MGFGGGTLLRMFKKKTFIEIGTRVSITTITSEVKGMNEYIFLIIALVCNEIFRLGDYLSEMF